MSDGPDPRTATPITELSLQQLGAVRQQMTQEAESLRDGILSLKSVNTKLLETKSALDSLKATEEGTQCYIPLTQSLYVEGAVASTDRVTVHLGTDYYAEKTVEEAEKMFDRKIELILQNATRAQGQLDLTQKNLDSVTQVMQAKMAAARGESAAISDV